MDLAKISTNDLLTELVKIGIDCDKAQRRYIKAEADKVPANRLALIHKKFADLEVQLRQLKDEVFERCNAATLRNIETLAASTVITEQQSQALKTVFEKIREAEQKHFTNFRAMALEPFHVSRTNDDKMEMFTPEPFGSKD